MSRSLFVLQSILEIVLLYCITISSKILEQVDQVDSSMTEIAIKESIEENKEQMITKLFQSQCRPLDGQIIGFGAGTGEDDFLR